jgi:hypothetical protein
VSRVPQVDSHDKFEFEFELEKGAKVERRRLALLRSPEVRSENSGDFSAETFQKAAAQSGVGTQPSLDIPDTIFPRSIPDMKGSLRTDFSMS